MRINTIRSSVPSIVAVNETIIASADIAREVQNHKGGSPVSAWEAATRALIVRQLLAQRAQALGIVPAPRSENGLRETDEEASIRMLMEAEVKTPTAREEDCRRYYQSNLERFRGSDLYEPVHILFKAAQRDHAAYETAVERAEAVLADLRLAPDRFESIARAMSDCPSATDGGRLGQVEEGDTTPAFSAALRSLEPGEICPTVVRTPYGVHILRLDRKVAGHMLPFEQVHERIAAWLEAFSAHRAVAQYVALLAGQAKISGFNMNGASSPLVQ